VTTRLFRRLRPLRVFQFQVRRKSLFSQFDIANLHWLGAPPRSAKGHGSIRRLPPTPNDLATPSPTYKMPEPTYYDGSETNSFSPSHYDVRTTNPLNYPYMDDLPAATPRPNPSHAGRHATVYVGNDSDGPRIRYPGGHDTLIEIPPARLVEDGAVSICSVISKHLRFHSLLYLPKYSP